MSTVPHVLGGRYQLLREIDRGGMGVVWEADDSRLGRRVAVKLLHAQFASDPEFLERFRREARSAAALSHPNVVAVYDVGQDGAADTPYIVMELVTGESLKQRIRRLGPMADQQVREVGAVVGRALDYAHRRGVVHRDVKPENILLGDDGSPKLTDFGIAEAVAASGLTRTGAVMGSVHYLAPELARGQPATPRSDVYSLGVVLYEMATGRVPFTGDTELAIALAHVEREAPAPRAVNPSVTPALEGIIVRAMARSPEARFASAADLARALSNPTAQSATVRMPTVPQRAAPAADRTATVAVSRVAAPSAGGPRRAAPRPGARPNKSGGSGWGLLSLLLVLAVVLVAVGVGFFGLATLSREGPPLTAATATVPTVTPTALVAPPVVPTPSPLPPTPSPTATTEPSPSPQPSPTPAPPTATPAPTAAPTPRVVVVPDLVGRSSAQATAALQAAGLGARVQRVNVNGEPDTVVAQSQSPGTAVVPGSQAATIVLSVASGQVTIPDVAGKPREEALQQLLQAGFKVPVVRERKDNRAPPGAALETAPPANKVVPRGSEVELTVAAAR